MVDKGEIDRNILKYTSRGYRVIVVAFSRNADLDNLIFAGFAILKDEIRKDAREGIALIEKAGVRLVMVTGDSIDTAMFIGRELGIVGRNDVCLTSGELALMSDDELKGKIGNVRIVARAKPSDKSRLVRIFKELNLVVGMTGDGINYKSDASAEYNYFEDEEPVIKVTDTVTKAVQKGFDSLFHCPQVRY